MRATALTPHKVALGLSGCVFQSLHSYVTQTQGLGHKDGFSPDHPSWCPRLRKPPWKPSRPLPPLISASLSSNVLRTRTSDHELSGQVEERCGDLAWVLQRSSAPLRPASVRVGGRRVVFFLLLLLLFFFSRAVNLRGGRSFSRRFLPRWLTHLSVHTGPQQHFVGNC